MFERILGQQQPLCAILLEFDLTPKEVDMNLFIQVLKPIVEITEAFGAQKFATISMIRPLWWHSYSMVFSRLNSEGDSRLYWYMHIMYHVRDKILVTPVCSLFN